MRVLCVKWGDKYGPEWVYRLRDMVKRNLKIDHDFVCMTDKPIPDVECVPCEPGLPTWWAKIGLFKPGKFDGLNLYLDLDVVITDDITMMIHEDGDAVDFRRLVVPDDFSYSLLNPKHGIGGDMRRLLGGDGTVNSSVMMWANDDCSDIWNRFKPEKMDEVHGDQNYITQVMWPDKIHLLDPKWVCSYKYHVKNGENPRPITVFHGNPKVTELPDFHPLRQAWAA